MNTVEFYNLLEKKADSRANCWMISGYTIYWNGKIWSIGVNKTGDLYHSKEPWSLAFIKELLDLKE